MARIRLVDAARHFNGEPHQVAAWNALQEAIDNEALQEFEETYRAAVPSKVQDPPNSWAGVTQAAREAGSRFPDLVAAQWALESGWGKRVSGRHNYFGQKGTGSAHQTVEYINGEPRTVTATFINFASLRESVQYLVDRWYKDFTYNGKKYRGVNHAASRDAAAKMLVSEGYATDPLYAEKLIRLMRENAPLPEAQAPAKLAPNAPFSARLTPHIRLGEFALDQEARRFDHQHQVETAAELAAFLERVRVAFKKPVVITSGYRPPEVNRAVGGAAQSEHLYSVPQEGAVDFVVEGADIQGVQEWVDKYWPHSVGYGADKGFVHLGRRADGARRRWDY